MNDIIEYRDPDNIRRSMAILLRLYGLDIKSYRNLNNEEKLIIQNMYIKNLSKHPESFTPFEEIENKIGTDESIHVDVLIKDGIILAGIQYKHCIGDNLVIVDYVYSINNNATQILISSIKNIYHCYTIVTEVTFKESSRIAALCRLANRYGLYDLGIEYLQPNMSNGVIHGRLLSNVKSIENIDKIIRIIYYKHYMSWYNNINRYKYKLHKTYLKYLKIKKNVS